MECRTSRNVDLIPGRVEKLPLNENRREEPEWGLHFVEGLNFFGILVVVGISVSVSIACCIAVTVVYKDSGKGAGWGAFAAAVVAIFVACAALVSKV
jgi:hypothetical protein